MDANQCQSCPVQDLQEIKNMVENKITGKLPKEVRIPLAEARKQIRIAFRGAINNILQEESSCADSKSVKPRKLEIE